MNIPESFLETDSLWGGVFGAEGAAASATFFQAWVDVT